MTTVSDWTTSARGLGSVSSRVPDNATAIDPKRPDPVALSFEYMQKNPAKLKLTPSGGSIDFADLFGSAAASPAVLANTKVVGSDTVYAGTICPSPAQQPMPDPKPIDCTPDNAQVTIESPASPEESAIAQALGAPASDTTTYECINITGIRPDYGALSVSTFLLRSFVYEGANGSFGLHVPEISVSAVTQSGRTIALPTSVELFDGELINWEVGPHISLHLSLSYPPTGLQNTSQRGGPSASRCLRSVDLWL